MASTSLRIFVYVFGCSLVALWVVGKYENLIRNMEETEIEISAIKKETRSETHIRQGNRYITGDSPQQQLFLPAHLQHVDQHDTELIQYIKDFWIVPPSDDILNLDHPETVDFSQFGQSVVLDNHLQNMTNGFFLECGAATGEKLSNSLFFERERDWTGILIEANPHSFRKLLSRNRRAYAVNACLSPGRTPMVMNFTNANVLGGISDFMKRSKITESSEDNMEIQCLPLYSIISATGAKRVDYLSLDIEGAEMSILRTVPFEDTDIRIFGIETSVEGDRNAALWKRQNISLFLEEFGYRKVDTPYFMIDVIMEKE